MQTLLWLWNAFQNAAQKDPKQYTNESNKRIPAAHTPKIIQKKNKKNKFETHHSM